MRNRATIFCSFFFCLAVQFPGLGGTDGAAFGQIFIQSCWESPAVVVDRGGPIRNLFGGWRDRLGLSLIVTVPDGCCVECCPPARYWMVDCCHREVTPVCCWSGTSSITAPAAGASGSSIGVPREAPRQESVPPSQPPASPATSPETESILEGQSQGRSSVTAGSHASYILQERDSSDSNPLTRVRILVPSSARLNLAGSPSKLEGPDRVFTTRELALGQTWGNYQIVAELERDGRILREVHTLEIRAGGQYEIRFEFAAPEFVSR